jgi:hypothetical protein
LLEFDDDVRRLPAARVSPGEHDIRSLRSQREVMFNEHLDVSQAGLD